MTKLSTSYEFTNGSDVKFSNTTGFTPTNTDGFLPSSTVIDWATTIQSKSFKLDEVYFFNAVIYNPYNDSQYLENMVDGNIEEPIKVTLDSSFPAILDKTYTLSKDGYHILGQLIALEKSYYESHKSTNRFNGNDYIVYDTTEKLLYHAKSGVYTKLTLIDLFDDQLVIVDYMRSVNKLVTTTNLYSCYMTVMDLYIKNMLSTCTNCSWNNDFLLLYMTLEAIKYRTQSCEFTMAQKYIEWINSCTSICSKNYSLTSGSSTSSNCGCK